MQLDYQQIYHLGQGHQEILHAQFIIIHIFSFDVKALRTGPEQYELLIATAKLQITVI